MPLVFPQRDPGNFWQDAGQALQQGAGIVTTAAQQSNVLQDMVRARAEKQLEEERLAREEMRKNWEFQQKQDDSAKADEARKKINDMIQNGVLVPGVTTVIPPSTRMEYNLSPDLQDLQTGRPNALLGPAYVAPPTTITTPGSSVTTPDSYRPATMQDFQRAALPTEDPATFVKNLTPPNKAAAMSAARSFILQAKAAGNKVIKSSDIEAAALAADPTGAISTDKDFLAFKKNYATDVQAQTAETGIVNSGIKQQNADTAAERAKDLTAYQRASLERLNNMPVGGAMNTRSLLTDSRAARTDYEKAAKPYLALKAIKNSPSYGTGLGDQSMIDKLILIETGKVPTEAQYFQVAKNLGFADKLDKVTGKLLNGEIMGPVARKNLELQAEEQMKITHSAYQDDLAQFGDMAKENGVNPNAVSRHGGYYDSVNKYLGGEDVSPGPSPMIPPKSPTAPTKKPKRDPMGLF